MKKKIKICIIQLTRLGDLIQTTQAITDHNNENDLEFSLVSRETFSNPIKYKLDQVFHKIFPINLTTIFQSKKLYTAKSDFTQLINQINAEDFDLVINLTFSKASGYLSSLIKSKARTGLYFDQFNNLKIDDQMSRYFYTNVNNSIYNSTHIIDLFKQIIGLDLTTRQIKTIKNTKDTITIHPFTSKEKKQWHHKKWTEIIYKLVKDIPEIKINIIGSKSEEQGSLDIIQSPILKKYRGSIKNFTGKTTIEQTEEIIKNSSLIIAHDSLNIHLASINGVKSIMIALGSSRIYETAPYLSGSFVVSPKADCFPCHVSTACSDYSCHNNISYQAIVDLAKNLIIDGDITDQNIDNINLFSRTNLILHRVEYSNNFITLNPIINHSKNENLRRILNTTWQYFINEIELKLDLVKTTELDTLGNLQGHINYIFELTQFGKTYSEYILQELSKKDPKLEKIKEYSNNIDEIEKLFTQLTPIHPELASFLGFFKFERANLKGNNVAQISEQSYLSFQSMEIFAKILFELLNSVKKKSATHNSDLSR